MKKILIIATLTFSILITPLAFSSPDSTANPSDSQNYQGKWWLNLGAVMGGSNSSSSDIYTASGLGINSSINIMTFQHQLLTLSATSEGIVGAIPFFGLFIASDSTTFASLLYGLIGKNQHGYISLSTGISRIKFRDETEFVFGDYTNTVKHSAVSIGLPIQSQIFWTPCRFFGLGLVAFANINHIKNFYGGGIEIQVGNLK